MRKICILILAILLLTSCSSDSSIDDSSIEEDAISNTEENVEEFDSEYPIVFSDEQIREFISNHIRKMDEWSYSSYHSFEYPELRKVVDNRGGYESIYYEMFTSPIIHFNSKPTGVDEWGEEILDFDFSIGYGNARIISFYKIKNISQISDKEYSLDVSLVPCKSYIPDKFSMKQMLVREDDSSQIDVLLDGYSDKYISFYEVGSDGYVKYLDWLEKDGGYVTSRKIDEMIREIYPIGGYSGISLYDVKKIVERYELTFWTDIPEYLWDSDKEYGHRYMIDGITFNHSPICALKKGTTVYFYYYY